MKWPVIAVFAFALTGAQAETPTDAAVGLYNTRHYAEAAAVLGRILGADPKNAAACYYLGMSLQHGSGANALEDSLPWLEKAVALAPDREDYLVDYGGTCLLIAGHEHSFSYATRGRDAMTKAIAMNPGDLDARTGLMRFYAQAPWPLGSSSLALAQAHEIGRRDSARGPHAFLRLAQIFEKNDDRPAALDACQAALKLDPANATAAAAVARLRAP